MVSERYSFFCHCFHFKHRFNIHFKIFYVNFHLYSCCRPNTCYNSGTTMEPQWTPRFQHSAPLRRHAPGSSWIFSPQNIRPSTLHDREGQHSSFHAHCIHTSSRNFPHGSSDVRNRPLPHCFSSMYLFDISHFKRHFFRH